MDIRCLGDGIGAEITGLDVRSMDDAAFARIYRAWLDYNVIVVRDQHLATEDFLAYSRRFGPLAEHPSKNTRHPDHAEITLLGVNKFGPDGKLDNKIYRRGAENFHTDGNYEQEPFKATQLYALAIPSRGGDTYFASMYTAYDMLPERLKTHLEVATASTSMAGARRNTTRCSPGKTSNPASPSDTRFSAPIAKPAAGCSISIR